MAIAYLESADGGKTHFSCCIDGGRDREALLGLGDGADGREVLAVEDVVLRVVRRRPGDRMRAVAATRVRKRRQPPPPHPNSSRLTTPYL